MKITRKQLRRIVSEACGEVSMHMHDERGRLMGSGGKSRMVRSSLFNIASRTQSLHDKLRDEDELPEWVQSKVASILDDVHEIEDHLGYKIHRKETDPPQGTMLEQTDKDRSYPAIEEFDKLTREADIALRSWLGFMSRAPISDMEDLGKLWNGIVATPRDPKGAQELARALGFTRPGVVGAASFHARKIKPGTDYPTGAELVDLIKDYRDQVKKRRIANPPPPRPVKPYGGGTARRPYDRST